MTAGIVQGLPFMSSTGIELAVSLSVIALGLLLAFAVKMPAWATASLALLAGLAHGAAHAGEGPTSGGLTAFAIGALLATASLHAVGVFGGVASRRLAPALSRIVGAAMAVFGVGLTLGVI
jgi:urease accessory protein